MAVDDVLSFHKENLKENKEHYTYFVRLLKGKPALWLHRYGAKMLFNTVEMSQGYLEGLSRHLSEVEREERARRGLSIEESEDEEEQVIEITVEESKLREIEQNVDKLTDEEIVSVSKPQILIISPQKQFNELISPLKSSIPFFVPQMSSPFFITNFSIYRK